jgi:hypothetical protein
MAKHDDDNHSNQLNPNNDAYWEARGWDERPDDWENRLNNDGPDALFPPVTLGSFRQRDRAARGESTSGP